MRRKLLRIKARMDQFDARVQALEADAARLAAETEAMEERLVAHRAEIESTLEREMKYLAACGLL